MEQRYIEQLNKKIMEFDLNLINKDVVTEVINSVNDLVITKEKLGIWKSEMETGAVVISAKGDRYLIVSRKKISLEGMVDIYSIVNLNDGITSLEEHFHSNIESLLTTFILDFNNPIVKVIPKIEVLKAFAGIV
ncbi:hypothetical protein [Bacillus toyonensis]|uniref:hypothetical protein n=1 Tax=Bacillus toyonensis TaxID=155322 RepID=UPI002E23F614|nr:hypothetical protein [Bacillus toyonensis]